MQLDRIIREEISIHGSIPFTRFMDLALYHPRLGYYRRGKDPFGINGDFYTAGQLPVFSELLAIYVNQLSGTFEACEPFEVLELGAGRGELREALHPWNYRAYDWGTDPLPESFSGLVIANEFFDALPVHLLRRTEKGWRELGVACEAEGFTFREMQEDSPELEEYGERYGAALPAGGLLEVNLAMRSWLKSAGEILRGGRLLVIDYGYSTPELARFPAGTLMGYREHTADPKILGGPGTQDITAHVNFSQLRDDAVESGFVVIGESSLQTWALSFCQTSEWTNIWERADARWRLQWKQLVFGMGETFRVLELEKAITK